MSETNYFLQQSFFSLFYPSTLPQIHFHRLSPPYKSHVHYVVYSHRLVKKTSIEILMGTVEIYKFFDVLEQGCQKRYFSLL